MILNLKKQAPILEHHDAEEPIPLDYGTYEFKCKCKSFFLKILNILSVNSPDVV